MPVFGVKLPCSVVFSKAAAAGQSLFRFAPSHKMTRLYEDLTNEIINGGAEK